MDKESFSAAHSASVVSPSERCVGCGVAAAAGETLLKCGLCSDLRLPGGCYCSRKCQKADWKKHKAWHAVQASASREHEIDAKDDAKDDEATAAEVEDPEAVKFHAYYIRLLDPQMPAAEALARAESQVAYTSSPSGELLRLLNRAAALRDDGDLSKSARTFNKAIKFEPHSPFAYDALGDVLSRSHNGQDAAVAFMQAMDRYRTCSLHWASCAVKIYDIMNRPLKDKPPFPTWWNDESLKVISNLVVGATRPDEVNVSASDRVYALAMRGEVLSCIGPPRLIMGSLSLPQWTLGLRTPEEMREGGEYFRAAAKLASTASYPARAEKEGFVIAAVACFKRSKEV